MYLSECFSKKNIIRDGVFHITMYPQTNKEASLCYAGAKSVCDVINKNDNISCVITTKDLAPVIDEDKGIVVSENPQKDYFRLHNSLVEQKKMVLFKESKISKSSKISSTAIIGDNVIIGKNVVISDYAFVDNFSIIGDNTFVGPYVHIGAKGMQNNYVENVPYPVQYCGGVHIGENCEILSHAIIQKPYQSFFTEIGDGTKISVRCSIGHGVTIGTNSMIAGNTTIAGNVKAGKNLWVGPGSVISDGIHIGDNVRVNIGSIVISNLMNEAHVSGNFAIKHQNHMMNIAKIKRSRK